MFSMRRLEKGPKHVQKRVRKWSQNGAKIRKKQRQELILEAMKALAQKKAPKQLRGAPC